MRNGWTRSFCAFQPVGPAVVCCFYPGSPYRVRKNVNGSDVCVPMSLTIHYFSFHPPFLTPRFHLELGRGEGAQRGGGCCSGPLPAGSGGGVRGSRDGRAGDHIPAVPAHLTEARYQGKGARLLLVLKVIKHPPRLGFCLWSRVSTLQCRFDFHWHLGFCSW